MAASKLQMNWTSVGLTVPAGGTLVPITKVKEVQIDPGGSIKTFEGDADKFPTTVVNDISRPKITVRGGSVAVMQGFHPGDQGTFTATFNDAKLGVDGAIVYTVINAVVENVPGGGAHNEFGESTMTLMAFSSDGSTSPISFTRV